MFTSGSWKVKKGNEQEFIDTWKAFANTSGGTMPPGAGYGYLLRDTRDPSHFITFGEWEDLESIKAWRNSPDFDSYMKKFDDLCESHEIATLETVAKIRQLREAFV